MRDMAGLMKAALACTTKAEAQRLVRAETAAYLAMWSNATEDNARKVVLGNVGFITGEGMTVEERTRVLDLFDTRHPWFGSAVEWPKTPEEIFALGVKMGERMKHEQE